MKAWTAREYGGPEVLEMSEIEQPGPAPGRVLVEVHSVALNPYDAKLRNGVARMMTGRAFPKVFGGDFEGIVVESQDKSGTFEPGQQIYGFVNLFFREQGALAEFTNPSPRFLRHVPSGVDSAAAAASTSTGLTALSGIQKIGDVNGKRVLIVGATGGVGHLAIQMLVKGGAEVSAVCSTRNIGLARELGAADVIDYTKSEIFGAGETYDVIFDAAAKLDFTQARTHLDRHGVYCTTQEGFGAAARALVSGISGGRRMLLSSFRGRPEDFDELERFLSGDVRPFICEEFSFQEADKAFQLLESGKAAGKIVVRVKGRS